MSTRPERPADADYYERERVEFFSQGDLFRDTRRKEADRRLPASLPDSPDPQAIRTRNPATFVKQDKQKLSQLRGRVVHAGYRPSREEAGEALAVAGRMDEFIRTRVAASRNRYPRTALLVLGRPGLERLSLWGGLIERFAEHADEEPDWIASYNEWRAKLTVERT